MNIGTKEFHEKINVNFFKNLESILFEKKCNFKIILNVNLILLYWKIGNEINKSNNEKFETDLIYKFKKSGTPFLIDINLEEVKQFSNQFTDIENVKQIASILNWWQIQLILKIKNEGNNLRIIKEIVNNNYKPNKIKKLIEIYEKECLENFEKKKISKKEHQKIECKLNFDFDNVYLQGINNQINNKFVLENMFENVNLRLFLTNNNKLKIDDNNLDIIKIYNYINEFKVNLNIEINFVLNMVFWEIGNYITLFFQNNKIKEGEQNKILHFVVKNLHIKLTKTDMKKMMQFAKIYKQPQNASIISSMIDWELISYILKFQSVSYQIELAKIASYNCWSKKKLSKYIESNPEINFSELVSSDFNSFGETKKSTLRKSNKNKVMISKKSIYKTAFDSKLQIITYNVFKNKYINFFQTGFN